MAVYRYCTPAWLEESAKRYLATPRFKEELKKVSVKVCFLIKAEPAWGIDEDIIFGAFVDQGELETLAFMSGEDAKREAEYILAATPQEWKMLLRKESKFITEFMLGKIILEKGSKVGVLGLAPHATTFVNSLTQFDLQFPDEMSSEELNDYQSYVKKFRAELGV